MNTDEKIEKQEYEDLLLTQMEIKPEMFLNRQIIQCQNCLRMNDTADFNQNKAFFIANVNVLEGMARGYGGILPEEDIKEVIDGKEVMKEKSYETEIATFKETQTYKELDKSAQSYALASFKFYKLFGYICQNQPQHGSLRMGK